MLHLGNLPLKIPLQQERSQRLSFPFTTHDANPLKCFPVGCGWEHCKCEGLQGHMSWVRPAWAV